jgi:hypothetical protein
MSNKLTTPLAKINESTMHAMEGKDMISLLIRVAARSFDLILRKIQDTVINHLSAIE